MQELHFFDVDHTITASVTSVQYLFQGIALRCFPLRPVFSIPKMLFDYRDGDLSIDTFFRKGIPFIEGKTRTSLEELADIAFEKRIKNHIYRDAYTLIKELQTQQRQVVLATSSIDVIIAPLLRFLKVDTGICSSLMFQENICTGKFEGPLAYGPEKRRRVLDYIEQQQVPLQSCYFYSDSINDLPLLLEIGHPVIINPDKKLRREALARDWDIRSFTRRL